MELQKPTREKFLPNPKLKLREQLREVMRFRHFSPRTESAYWLWIKGYLQFHRNEAVAASPPDRMVSDAARGASGWRHPKDMGAVEVRAYLSHLAVKKNVAAATQCQALNALVFLYREVLGQDLGAIGQIERPTRSRKIPTVMSKAEVRRVLALMAPEYQLICRLLYGTGMRLLECLRLRIHPVR